ncbi:MAG TPA: XrtB/PEP-CTERM-associated transcriptional regulator EpsA [Gammaproteobacteria bacterium]|nr:XrtB/PEP-CTERM-associated transcriptional regulator EpsA [Gammaproteobacteria bacterium]
MARGISRIAFVADMDAGEEPDTPRSVLLESRELEALLLNIDASLSVNAARQFYTWTQGLLQGLVPHRMLFCLRRGGEPSAFVLDTFSALVSEATELGSLLMRDPVLMPNLVELWKAARYAPAIREVSHLGTHGGVALARALERAGVARIAVHGCHDADGEMTSLFVFACRPSDIGVDQTYLLQLIVPFLSAAWTRTQIREREPGSPRGLCGPVLTAREREVLHWIYLGKGNAEVGTILHISSLTVKNHVQKILRKLNVANRAQAVGKALEARLIRP